MSQSNVANIVKEYIDGSDPAKGMEGVAPNLSQYAIPHIMTLQGLVTTISRTYRHSDEALRDSYENARFMENDCGLWECIDARRRSVALLNWHLEPENPKAPKQKELCDTLTDALNRIPGFLRLRENLLAATWYGRYAVQSKYGFQYIKGKRVVVPHSWLPVHGDKLIFKIDTDEIGIRVGAGRDITGMKDVEGRVVQTERGLGYFLTPDERKLLTLHKHQIEDGAYEDPFSAGKVNGVGIRSRIYWSWYQMQETLAWLMEFIERSAFGIELWYYPMGNAKGEEDTRKAAEQRIGNGRNIVLVPRPMGEDRDAYGVDHIEPGLGGVSELKSLITDYFGHRIKRFILGQTLTSEADATGLGSGLAELHLGTFLDIVRYDARNLEETITNELLRHIQHWTAPDSRNVHIRFVIETESQDSDKKLEAAERAWQMGCKIKESDIMDMVGMSSPTDDDDILQQQGGGDMGAFGGMNPMALDQHMQKANPFKGPQIPKDPGSTKIGKRGGKYTEVNGKRVYVK